jgi:hypothetical protein
VPQSLLGLGLWPQHETFSSLAGKRENAGKYFQTVDQLVQNSKVLVVAIEK